jgi:phosphoribosylformylglycinamidine synthase
VALAETAFAGGLGLAVDLAAVPCAEPMRSDELLFSESQSRFVATVAPENCAAFEAKLAGSVLACIGTVCAEPVLRIDGPGGARLVEEGIAGLKAAWLKPLAF